MLASRHMLRKAQDLEESLFEENDMDLERLNIS